jgi:hypothetical protein
MANGPVNFACEATAAAFRCRAILSFLATGRVWSFAGNGERRGLGPRNLMLEENEVSFLSPRRSFVPWDAKRKNI